MAKLTKIQTVRKNNTFTDCFCVFSSLSLCYNTSQIWNCRKKIALSESLDDCTGNFWKRNIRRDIASWYYPANCGPILQMWTSRRRKGWIRLSHRWKFPRMSPRNWKRTIRWNGCEDVIASATEQKKLCWAKSYTAKQIVIPTAVVGYSYEFFKWQIIMLQQVEIAISIQWINICISEIPTTIIHNEFLIFFWKGYMYCFSNCSISSAHNILSCSNPNRIGFFALHSSTNVLKLSKFT